MCTFKHTQKHGQYDHKQFVQSRLLSVGTSPHDKLCDAEGVYLRLEIFTVKVSQSL